jgi:hypothetical protein
MEGSQRYASSMMHRNHVVLDGLRRSIIHFIIFSSRCCCVWPVVRQSVHSQWAGEYDPLLFSRTYVPAFYINICQRRKTPGGKLTISRKSSDDFPRGRSQNRKKPVAPLLHVPPGYFLCKHCAIISSELSELLTALYLDHTLYNCRLKKLCSAMGTHLKNQPNKMNAQF